MKLGVYRLRRNYSFYLSIAPAILSIEMYNILILLAYTDIKLLNTYYYRVGFRATFYKIRYNINMIV